MGGTMGKVAQLRTCATDVVAFLRLPTQSDYVLDGLDNCRNRGSEKLARLLFALYRARTLVHHFFQPLRSRQLPDREVRTTEEAHPRSIQFGSSGFGISATQTNFKQLTGISLRAHDVVDRTWVTTVSETDTMSLLRTFRNSGNEFYEYRAPAFLLLARYRHYHPGPRSTRYRRSRPAQRRSRAQRHGPRRGRAKCLDLCRPYFAYRIRAASTPSRPSLPAKSVTGATFYGPDTFAFNPSLGAGNIPARWVVTPMPTAAGAIMACSIRVRRPAAALGRRSMFPAAWSAWQGRGEHAGAQHHGRSQSSATTI